MSNSNTERLTPGTATGVVFYIAAAVLAVMSLALVIAAGNNAIIISPEMHLGLFVLSLASAGGLSTLAAAAIDDLYSWPKAGPVDPAPHQALPNIDWSKSGMAIMWNYYIISAVFTIISAGLLIAGTKGYPSIVLAPWFHFVLDVASLSLSAWFFLGAASVQMRNVNGDVIMLIALWTIAIVLAIISAGLGIAAGNGAVLFNPGFHFVVCFSALAGACYTYYLAGREHDGDSKKRTCTGIYLFVIAAVVAIAGIIAAIAGSKVIIFSAAFHVGLVIVLLLIAAAIAVYAALIADRS